MVGECLGLSTLEMRTLGRLSSCPSGLHLDSRRLTRPMTCEDRSAENQELCLQSCQGSIARGKLVKIRIVYKLPALQARTTT